MVEINPQYIRSDAQIDQLILSPSFMHTQCFDKVPNIIKKQIFALDERGNKIPVYDETGRAKLNEAGEIIHVIKETKEETDGYTFKEKPIPAVEPVSIDLTSTALSYEDRDMICETTWIWSCIAMFQNRTRQNYSEILRHISSGNAVLEQANKSLFGNSLATVKTFITKSEGVMKNLDMIQEQKKVGFMDKLMEMFGGKKQGSVNTQQQSLGVQQVPTKGAYDRETRPMA
jgi:hypothetical protein